MKGIFYHGSKSTINSFVDDFVGGENAFDQEGPGIYFTNNENEASVYGNYIYKVELTLDKIVSVKSGKPPLKDINYLVNNCVDSSGNKDLDDVLSNWAYNKFAAKKMLIEAIMYGETPHEIFQTAWYECYCLCKKHGKVRL